MRCTIAGTENKKELTDVVNSLMLYLNGAGGGIRTRDLNLGKVALYQLSYTRIFKNVSCRLTAQI